ncbi:hypothetical protein GCM10029964_124630 [Kibdelosporangium lantanae]
MCDDFSNHPTMVTRPAGTRVNCGHTVADMPFDPSDPAFAADPYPTFATLRAVGPVHHVPKLGMAVAVSHAACSEVLRNRSLGRIWSDATPIERFTSFNLLHRNSLLENEAPTHTRLRRLVSAAFGRGHVERLRPWVAGVADELVASLASGGDVLAQVAAPLPVAVIAELLGVPTADRPLLVPWSNAIVKMYEYHLPEPQRVAAEQAAAEFVAYLRDLSAHPAPGSLISDLVTVRDSDDRLDQDELVATSVLLLMAGHEATVNVIGNGVLALLRHRDQWRRLVDDPSLIPTAVEEMIRYDAPLQLFERTAVADVTVAGYPVKAGRRSPPCWARQPATRRSSTSRTSSTRAGIPIPTWGSARGSTTASEPHSPGWRSPPRLPHWSGGCPRWSWPVSRSVGPSSSSVGCARWPCGDGQLIAGRRVGWVGHPWLCTLVVW